MVGTTRAGLSRRMIAADTIALLLFSICAGGLTLIFEIVVANLTIKQWAGIRILYNILRYVGARLCGKLTNKIRLYLLGINTSWHRVRKAAADTIALSLYHRPLYAASAFIMGADASQVITASALYLLGNLMLGWFYGMILDWTRKRIAGQLQ